MKAGKMDKSRAIKIICRFMTTTVNDHMSSKYRWGEMDPTDLMGDDIPCTMCGRIVDPGMSEFALHGICSRDCAKFALGRILVRSF